MKNISAIMALAITFLLTFNIPSHAHEHNKPINVGDLVISQIWARTTPKTARTGAAFFTVQNNGKTDDTLIGISSSIAKKTQIHQSSMEKDIMKMRHVGKVAVPAGGMAQLKPGNLHVMFIGLHKPINKGDEFPLTLRFEKSGSVKIMVKAQRSAAKADMNHSKIKKTN